MVFIECEELLNCFCMYAPWRTWYLVFRVSVCEVKNFIFLRTFVGKLIYHQEVGRERPFYFTKHVSLLFQMIVETLENTILLPFYFVWHKCPLLQLFPGEAEFRHFWIWKRSYIYPLAFCHPSLVCFNLQRVQGDRRLFSTRTFSKAFVFIWLKENKYSQETWLLTPHFHLGNKQRRSPPVLKVLYGFFGFSLCWKVSSITLPILLPCD